MLACSPRLRRDGNISKGKDAIKTTGSLIKTEFEPFVRATDISRAEAEQRRVQLNRFTKEYKSGVDAFTDVANAAVAAMKRHPVPSAATTAAAADGGPDKADGRKGGKQEDSQKLWVPPRRCGSRTGLFAMRVYYFCDCRVPFLLTLRFGVIAVYNSSNRWTSPNHCCKNEKPPLTISQRAW